MGGTNIFSSVAAHADFIRAGYAKAGQEPWLEGQPNPQLAKVGAACAADADCRTNVCDVERKTCAEECSERECGEGFSCVAQGPRKICVYSPAPAADGCSVARDGSSQASTFVLSAFAVAVLLSSARRKKSA
jgi:hypothetical protein